MPRQVLARVVMSLCALAWEAVSLALWCLALVPRALVALVV